MAGRTRNKLLSLRDVVENKATRVMDMVRKGHVQEVEKRGHLEGIAFISTRCGVTLQLSEKRDWVVHRFPHP